MGYLCTRHGEVEPVQVCPECETVALDEIERRWRDRTDRLRADLREVAAERDAWKERFDELRQDFTNANGNWNIAQARADKAEAERDRAWAYASTLIDYLDPHDREAYANEPEVARFLAALELARAVDEYRDEAYPPVVRARLTAYRRTLTPTEED